MAEIKIEKKAPIWPWIVGLLLLMLVGAAIYFALADDNEEVIVEEIPMEEILPMEEESAVQTLPAEVQSFITFASEENNYTEGQMDIHHKYTGEALRKMGDAVLALAAMKGMSDNIDAPNLDTKLNAAADEIQENWKETDHADHIKKGFLLVSTALNQLAENSTNVDLKQEAKDIDPNTLTLEQKADVKDFINKTAMVMQKIAME